MRERERNRRRKQERVPFVAHGLGGSRYRGVVLSNHSRKAVGGKPFSNTSSAMCIMGKAWKSNGGYSSAMGSRYRSCWEEFLLVETC